MQIRQNQNSEGTSLTLSIKELISLKSQIDLNNTDLTNEPEWDDSQRAEYILKRILDYPTMEENKIILHPTKPIEEYAPTQIRNAHYIVGKTGRKELIAFYKYIGLPPYEDKQFSLLRAVNTISGNQIITSLENHQSPDANQKGSYWAYYLTRQDKPLDTKNPNDQQFLNIKLEIWIMGVHLQKSSSFLM